MEAHNMCNIERDTTLDGYEALLNSYKSKAESYRAALKTLRDDLEIKIAGSNIIVAMDFCDIFEHCFPALDIFRGNIYRYERENKDRYLRRELGRCALFYLLKSIYSRPVLLLPPYMLESIQFLRILSCELEDLNLKNKEFFDNFLDSLSKDLDKINLNDNKDKDEINDLLKKIDRMAPDLAYLVSPCFDLGKDGFISLLNTVVRPSTKGIYNYMELLDNIHYMNYDHIKGVMSNIRPEHIMSNKRDAKAVQYIEQINKRINNKDVMVLVSSAGHFRKFRNNIACSQEIQIGKNTFKPIFCEKEIKINDKSKKYPLLRSTRPFYIALMEICNLISRKNLDINNFDFNNLDLNDLLKVVNDDLNYIGSVLDSIKNSQEYVGLDGRARLDLILSNIECLSSYICIIEDRNRAELLVIIRHFLAGFKEREQIDNKTLADIVISLKKLKNEVGSEDFLINLRRLLTENEMDRLKLDLQMRDSFKYITRCDEYEKVLIHSAKHDLGKLLNEKSKNELKLLLNYDEVSLPKDFEIYELKKEIWAIVNSKENKDIFYINRRGKQYYLHVENLDLLNKELAYIKENYIDHKVEMNADVFNALVKHPTLDIFRNRIRPIFNKIDYPEKEKLRINYYYILDKIIQSWRANLDQF